MALPIRSGERREGQLTLSRAPFASELGQLTLSRAPFASGQSGLSLTPRRAKERGARGFLRRRGFTLIELMIVMTIVTILVSIAVPLYQRSIIRAKESVLRSNLFTLRTVIDEYTLDKQKAPQTLDDLVTDGYLRQIPIDPMTGSSNTWRVIMEDTMTSVNQTEPGIFDVRSGSDKPSLEGSSYAEW